MNTETTLAQQQFTDRGISISLRITKNNEQIISFYVSRSDTESGKEICVASGPASRYSNHRASDLFKEISLYREDWWSIHKAQLHAMAITAILKTIPATPTNLQDLGNIGHWWWFHDTETPATPGQLPGATPVMVIGNGIDQESAEIPLMFRHPAPDKSPRWEKRNKKHLPDDNWAYVEEWKNSFNGPCHPPKNQ